MKTARALFRNILVAYDGSAGAQAALRQAFHLARSEQADAWAARMAREAVDAAPDGVIVHHVARQGHVGEEIVKELEARVYDLIVLGSRGLGRAASNVLGSVNAFVHSHSRTPLVSIADGPMLTKRQSRGISSSPA